MSDKEASPTQQAVLPQYISWHQRQTWNRRPVSQPPQSVQPRYQSSFFYQDKPHLSSQHFIHKEQVRAEVLSNTMFCGVQRHEKFKGGTAGSCPPCPLCFSSSVSEYLLWWCWGAEIKERCCTKGWLKPSLASPKPIPAGFPGLQGDRWASQQKETMLCASNSLNPKIWPYSSSPNMLTARDVYPERRWPRQSSSCSLIHICFGGDQHQATRVIYQAEQSVPSISTGELLHRVSPALEQTIAQNTDPLLPLQPSSPSP